MFLKSLRISNKTGEIRHIKFHAGLNLIVDETPSGPSQQTGNNVGKTTVLMLVDYCLGASPKPIYTDPENKKAEYALIKNFLIETEVVVELVLVDDIEIPLVSVLIERNFLARKQAIRRFNGVQRTEDEFEQDLTNLLVPGHYGKKPTFAQIISHNIRYKDISVINTLRTLSEFTRDEEYEALHLFLMGCDFDQGDEKQRLLTTLREENAFKARLEAKQTRSAYETLLGLVVGEIEELDVKRSAFQMSSSLEEDFKALTATRRSIQEVGAVVAQLRLRYDLLVEALQEVQKGRVEIDMLQLRALYAEVSDRLEGVNKTFEELVDFHNAMVVEKTRYISKDLPWLREAVDRSERELALLLAKEKEIGSKISKSGSLEDLEYLVAALNDLHRRKGEYQSIIDRIAASDEIIRDLKAKLNKMETSLFSEDFEIALQSKINKFNRYFASVSHELYGERYAVKFDKTRTRTGGQVYKFSSFNTNLSSGKKQGEIVCFDIAYNLFADDEGIPCLHFLLNDKKELMHDNQLTKIARLVSREKAHVQLVVSILRDKLPAELNRDEYVVLQLSQQEKLFKI